MRSVDSVGTTGDETQRARSVRTGLAGVVALASLVLASGAVGKASFTDPAGDENAAPDITSLVVSTPALGTVEVQVTISNYAALPDDSWVNVWLDLDADRETGVVGFDVLVRYLAGGTIEFLVARGADLVAQPATGMSGSYDSGSLTLRIPSTVVGDAATIGVLAVGGRRQRLGAGTFVASDFAPNEGSFAWTQAGAQRVFPDPESDHEGAPDVTGVRATDANDGWIRFAISTRNYAVLPRYSIVVVYLDTDIRTATGEDGAELAVVHTSGEVNIQRWNAALRRFDQDAPPVRVRARNANGVLTIELHRGELGRKSRFRFRVVTAGFDPTAGTAAVDRAPDSGSFWPYALSPVLRLVAGTVSMAPADPRAGARLTIGMPVRWSDTSRKVGSGGVRCDVRADGTKVSASGRMRAGRAECTLRVPANARTIHGSLTARSGEKQVTSRFSFRVR